MELTKSWTRLYPVLDIHTGFELPGAFCPYDDVTDGWGVCHMKNGANDILLTSVGVIFKSLGNLNRGSSPFLYYFFFSLLL